MLGGTGHEGRNDIIRKTGVLNNILPSEQHHVRGLGRELLQRVQTIERIFAKKPETGIDGRASPGLQRTEAHAVEEFDDRQHLLSSHSGRRQRLMPVSQDGVIENNCFVAHLRRN